MKSKLLALLFLVMGCVTVWAEDNTTYTYGEFTNQYSFYHRPVTMGPTGVTEVDGEEYVCATRITFNVDKGYLITKIIVDTPDNTGNYTNLRTNVGECIKFGHFENINAESVLVICNPLIRIHAVEVYYKEKTEQFTVTTNVNNSDYGSITGGGTYEKGTQVTLQAKPNSGYHFTKWNDGVTEASRKVTVNCNSTYTASFEAHNFSIQDQQMIISSATCQQKAQYYYKCSACSMYGGSYEYGEKADHKYDTRMLAPSAESNGLYAYLCDYNCGTKCHDKWAIKDYTSGSNLELTGSASPYTTATPIALTDEHQFGTSQVAFSAPRNATYTRQMANEWGTIVVPFAITYDAAGTNHKLYYLSSANTGNLTFREYDHNAVIPAGTPMAVRAIGTKNSSGKYDITLSARSTEVTTTITPTVPVDGLTMKGTYADLSDRTAVYFVANNKFWKADSPITISPFRAWFEGTPSGNNVKEFNIIVDDDQTTAIHDANGTLYMVNGTSAKRLENGRIVIHKNGRKYNVNGQAMK